MLLTAFILGFLGSLHCAGMCGPLALAASGRSHTAKLAYNTGRILTYSAIGLVVGFFGKTLALAGIQRWLSISAGVAILLGLAATSRRVAIPFAINFVARLKRALGSLLKQNSFRAQFLLGSLNGLLPCGLVYTAAAGALAAGTIQGGAAYMFLFGLGTAPMLITVTVAGQKFPPALRFKLQSLVPAAVSLVAALLILRGLSLGIPYLSPDLATGLCCRN